MKKYYLCAAVQVVTPPFNRTEYHPDIAELFASASPGEGWAACYSGNAWVVAVSTTAERHDLLKDRCTFLGDTFEAARGVLATLYPEIPLDQVNDANVN